MKHTADWDLTPFFSSPAGDDFVAFRDGLAADLSSLLAEVAGLDGVAHDPAAWARWLMALEDAGARLGHLQSYLDCLGAADGADERVRRETAGLAALSARLEKAGVAARAALGVADEAAFAALLSEPALEGAEHHLTRRRARARHSMSLEQEGLAADLGVNGLAAWGRLYQRVSGALQFELAVPGQPAEQVPVSVTRSLLEDPDAAVRQAAFAGAAQAWESVADTLACCLNAISGTRLSLYERRGVEHFLDPALFDAAIERRTLDTMWSVVKQRQPSIRRHLQRKARLLGRAALGFADLTAPLPARDGQAASIPWEQGCERVVQAFSQFAPELGRFAEQAIEERWIDHTPRPGKRPGAFCTSSHLLGQSRIFMTYNGPLGDVQTLAHELGHGYHSWLMRDMRRWARAYPMTLAETASTFAEQLVLDAALSDPQASDATRLALLETRLGDADAFLLNIPMRFDFECQLYERRAAGELSVSELAALMVAAQRDNYGDALDPDQPDPWFWASKLHFYITDVSFYNFPYSFGYLFSLGLFARAKERGPEFVTEYRKLLRRTGSAPAEQVVAEALGVDLGEPAFWAASIDLIESDLERFLQLTESGIVAPSS